MATTDTFGLSPEALKAARLNFRVAEGPFSATAQDIINYSDAIVLHVKRPPLAEGGMFGKCSYTLRFYAAGTLYYRVNLGRHTSEMKRVFVYDRRRSPEDGVGSVMEPALANDAGKIMSIWSSLEAKKDRALMQDFKIHKVTIKTQDVTVQQGVDFDAMSDLEILQKLNARTRDWVAAHPLPPKEYTIPDALRIELKNHRAA